VFKISCSFLTNERRFPLSVYSLSWASYFDFHPCSPPIPNVALRWPTPSFSIPEMERKFLCLIGAKVVTTIPPPPKFRHTLILPPCRHPTPPTLSASPAYIFESLGQAMKISPSSYFFLWSPYSKVQHYAAFLPGILGLSLAPFIVLRLRHFGLLPPL